MQETSSDYPAEWEQYMILKYATLILAEISHWHKTDGSVGKLSEIMDDVDDYLNEVKSVFDDI